MHELLSAKSTSASGPVRHMDEACFGVDVVDEDVVVGAECDKFVLRVVDCDSECLLTGTRVFDRVQALLRQVVPKAHHPTHVSPTTAMHTTTTTIII